MNAAGAARVPGAAREDLGWVSPGGDGADAVGIVDTHVHFWDTERLDYPWLAECGDLNAPMTPESLSAEIAGDEAPVPFRIKGFVQVQADASPAQTFDEIEWIRSLSAKAPMLGMVAYAPLEEGEACEGILAELEADPFVRGVRRSTQNEFPEFVERPGYVTGLELLGRHGLVADICARGFQLSHVTRALRELRERGSGTAVVIDHLGKPSIPDHPFDQWCADIAALASIPGTTCKLSGLLAECTDGRWSAERIRPYLEVVLERFGVDRVVFGGDWPIVKFVDARYRDWVRIVYGVVSQGGNDAVDKVFSGNALRTYGLPVPRP